MAELASTFCTCTNYLTGDNDYCAEWTCQGIGISKCKQSDSDCGVTRYFGSVTYQDSCCPGSHEKDLHYEFQECVCINAVVDNASSHGLTQCANWECIDYSTNTESGIKLFGTGYYEREQHRCEQRNVEGYCDLWTWTTDDNYSFENTACACVETRTVNGFTACAYYECMEEGANKFAPNLAWASFGLCFGVFLCPFLFVFVNNNSNDYDIVVYRALVAFIVMLIAVLVFLIPLLLGGLGALFFVILLGGVICLSAYALIYGITLRFPVMPSSKVPVNEMQVEALDAASQTDVWDLPKSTDLNEIVEQCE